jgi:hypothetical protein
MMSEALAAALRKVREGDWKSFGQEEDGTLRQWAEVDFVPGGAYEHKESRPLRYVSLRLLKPQGVLFADGSDRHYHAVVTNQTMDGARLLEWHREKAGTVEHTHDEVKNQLGGGHVGRVPACQVCPQELCWRCFHFMVWDALISYRTFARS